MLSGEIALKITIIIIIIQKLVVEDKRTKWQSAVDKCDHRTGISHLWRLVKGLSGKQLTQVGIRFADKNYLDPNMMDNKFAINS